MILNRYSKIIYIIILVFSYFITFSMGHLGVYPLDTFLFYDSSIRILNGEIPIKGAGINWNYNRFNAINIF